MESKKNNLKRYGLIGKKIEYSFSRGYFKEKFENENLPDCSYENFDLNHINEVKEVLGTPGIFGLNVTIPYKREIIPFLDKLSPAAAKMNAVNTIKFENDGSISGHNTDVFGFEKPSGLSQPTYGNNRQQREESQRFQEYLDSEEFEQCFPVGWWSEVS